ncbi:MAG: hypothetical protein Q8O00_09085, partial [Holophaga sp.]|nr:hypothetical protein [Holophaga sp.]
QAHLGYHPQQVDAQVALFRAGDPEPLTTFAIEPMEVIDAMDPIRQADREDQYRIREEEAKGFARVVVSKIQERFQWVPLAKPSWYGVKEGQPTLEDGPDEPIKVPGTLKAPTAPESPVKPEATPKPLTPAKG